MSIHSDSHPEDQPGSRAFEWVHLYECHDVVTLDLIKHALDHANIPCRILFEHSLRMGNAVIMGYQGAIVQVDVYDWYEAEELLDELNLRPDKSSLKPVNPFVRFAEKSTRNIPLINRLLIPYRILILAACFFILLYLTLVFISL
ncbi:MAG: DUF2007 domain-containing protein [Saprospiraceae bacterium]|nr:DUF2007 domain-containing protein [Saprospiraceae bacterium]MCB9319803.1 DUF2007 domain-containing protein [Lewinellaceae bacterium]